MDAFIRDRFTSEVLWLQTLVPLAVIVEPKKKIGGRGPPSRTSGRGGDW